MKMPRWMVMGTAVAGISTVLWNAALPDNSTKNPESATRQQLNERRLLQERRDQELRARVRAGVDAELAERARAAEARDAAEALARKLVRRGR